MSKLKIIQLTDMHIFHDANKELLGVNTHLSFQAVLSLMFNQEENIDAIFLSGDLTQDGASTSYFKLASMLAFLKMPIYVMPGNHDNEKNLLSTYPIGPIKTDRQVFFNKWQIITLNSQKPGAVEGFIDEEELTYLDQALKDYPDHHAIVMLHHQPVDVGSRWLDRLGVRNKPAFWDIIKRYPHLKLVLFGHVHQVFEQKENGIWCYSTPSTCIQFKPKERDFALDFLPPGYRWIDLNDDGTWETGVKRCAQYIGRFDADAKGY
ncbi:MAG: 3',5'-cyclic-AMP phosphodiesterase [Gammaproteobacteria bacterium]|nr:3',5'-cyclic-AMP phosphodiesterase [Gammaproteobacteria bacterium]